MKIDTSAVISSESRMDAGVTVLNLFLTKSVILFLFVVPNQNIDILHSSSRKLYLVREILY